MDTSKHPSSHLVDGLDTARSGDLFAAACELIPGGVNSTARATWAGWNPYPLFVDKGQGSRLTDVDGNEYIDYLLGLGPMIFGHRPPRVTQAVVDFIQQRGTFPGGQDGFPQGSNGAPDPFGQGQSGR